jgi:hypothetical protein
LPTSTAITTTVTGNAKYIYYIAHLGFRDKDMKEIGIGVIGTAFMGKAHSIAYASAGTAFGGNLRGQ